MFDSSQNLQIRPFIYNRHPPFQRRLGHTITIVMTEINRELLRERINHARVQRCLLTEKSTYLEHVQRSININQEEGAFIIEMPPRNLSILPSVINCLVSIHSGYGETVMGIVERIDDPVTKITLSAVCWDGDGYDSGEFPYGEFCTARVEIFEMSYLRNTWLLEVRTEQARQRYLEDKTIAEQDPQKFQYLTDKQQEAFDDFQLCEPSSRLHGSTVYGMSTPDSDVDVCINEDRLVGLADNADAVLIPFEIVSNLLHLGTSRLVLRHDNGVEFDVVGMDCYEPEKDVVLKRICQNIVFKTFLKKLQQWWKGCGLEPQDGYPNKFNLFLMAIFFLQCFEGVPSWLELAATDFVPLQCRHTANDLFCSFLHFLLVDSRRIKMDLHVGRWQEKRKGGSLRCWLLRDPCTNRNVFAGSHPDRVAEVLENHVRPKSFSEENVAVSYR